jgi:hypothetical protein
MTFRDWLGNIGFALSCLFNALLLGEPCQSLSARIGWSIIERGFFAQVWMPGFLRRHFENAAAWEQFK